MRKVRLWAVRSSILLALAAWPGLGQTPLPAGQNPQATLTPSRLDFGTQAIGTASTERTITLTNSGSADLTIADTLTSGIDFSEKSNCGKTLAAGANCSISLTFQPAIAGPRIGTLLVFDSAPHTPQMVPLTGTGQ